mmetsp:Transcript_98846/g.255512  ORF Transcript_98846/g.255512 Transcript_98846/m.255512 type:complete len:233 (+) Transcript_98846:1029-1727(+)
MVTIVLRVVVAGTILGSGQPRPCRMQQKLFFGDVHISGLPLLQSLSSAAFSSSSDAGLGALDDDAVMLTAVALDMLSGSLVVEGQPSPHLSQQKSSLRLDQSLSSPSAQSYSAVSEAGAAADLTESVGAASDVTELLESGHAMPLFSQQYDLLDEDHSFMISLSVEVMQLNDSPEADAGCVDQADSPLGSGMSQRRPWWMQHQAASLVDAVAPSSQACRCSVGARDVVQPSP